MAGKNRVLVTRKLRGLMEECEDDQLQSLLSSFSCEQDRDIQNFLHNRAMLFERLDKSRTYLIADNEQISAPGFKARNMTIYGYIKLSIKNFRAPETMSNRQRLLLDGFSAKEHGEPVEYFPCYLIGQLARNSNVPKDSVTGADLLLFAFDLIGKAFDAVGGRNILVECRNVNHLVQFYLDNDFLEISHIPDGDIEMVQLLRRI